MSLSEAPLGEDPSLALALLLHVVHAVSHPVAAHVVPASAAHAVASRPVTARHVPAAVLHADGYKRI